MPSEKIEALFIKFSKQLGPLKKYAGSEGKAFIAVDPDKGRQTTAAYSASLFFEKAPADVEIKLLLNGNGAWQISSFVVSFGIHLL